MQITSYDQNLYFFMEDL